MDAAHAVSNQRAKFESGVTVETLEGEEAAETLRQKFNVVPHVMHEKVVAQKAPVPDYWALVDGEQA